MSLCSHYVSHFRRFVSFCSLVHIFVVIMCHFKVMCPFVLCLCSSYTSLYIHHVSPVSHFRSLCSLSACFCGHYVPLSSCSVSVVVVHLFLGILYHFVVIMSLVVMHLSLVVL